MHTTSIEDSFKACWIKTILRHVLTKKEIRYVASQFQLITVDDKKLNKVELIKIINSGSQKDELIKELEVVLTRRGISVHLFGHLKDLYQKMERLEPAKLANIYLHMAERNGSDMARQVFDGEDLKKVFNHELMTMILYEVLAGAENKSLMIFEHIVNRNIALDK
jgi:hypothetical protein